MKRAGLLVAVLAIAAIAAATPTAEAAPGGRTFVSRDCLHAAIAPRQIMFACGDGGFYLTQGDWAFWHRYRAAGTAVFHLNDCTPSCAEGTFHTMRGTIALSRRERCADARRHDHVFTRATIAFDQPVLGRHRERARLFCPMS